MTNRILIIDDEKEIVELFQELLEIEYEDIKVESAFTVKNAIELLNNNKYFLIFTDFNMPVKNGYELVKSIRNSDSVNSKSPFIIITGEDKNLEDLFKEFSNVKVFYKSKDLEKLIDIVAEHLD